MSCKDCDYFQAGSQTSYFRWGTANIEVRACPRHLKEVYDALREAQSSELWRKQALKSQEKIMNQKPKKGGQMLQEFTATNHNDEKGKPAGGGVLGVGLKIEWQNGPLGRGEERIEPNGAFVETVIAAAKQRIQYYQDAGFACDENADAIFHLKEALSRLDCRTKSRESAGVEGTHERRA